ncbi:MAG: AAA family ATPase [Bacteroidales bacterium]|nr:AAA family ATPase [Bacteroidales bacterium]
MANKVFERKIYSKMLEWKKESNGKTALLIKGARRIGKSTIVELFAKKEYTSYILIDFANVSKQIIELFDDTMDLNYIFLRLQAIYNVILEKRKSVIIFDEIQNCPKARQAIKYLVKDGRYDYIETGSLISIKKNVQNIVIPSEETRLNMYPLDYEEFRWALGDKVTVNLLKEFYEKKISLQEAHRKTMRDLRLYMLIGGMPQAINEYLETNNLSLVDKVKRNILELYFDDLRKIDKSGRASLIFKSIPSELNKNASRYQISSVINNENRKNIVDTINDLKDSMIVNFAYYCNDPSVGFALHSDESFYKIFIADTGLFVTLAFWDKEYIENTIYQKLLSDKLSADLGYVYENLVAQMLISSGNRLYYYTFPHETSHKTYEIDFLLSRGSKICPIEVKSSGYKSHTSLDVFCKKYSDRISNKYLLYTKDFQKDKDIFCVPIYLTMFL